jgi:ribosomal protein S18 acetylase RimI-like enzyme
MQHVEQLLLKAGIPKINLLVRSTNVGVIEFYRRPGYAQDKAVRLGKRLIPDASAE